MNVNLKSLGTQVAAKRMSPITMTLISIGASYFLDPTHGKNRRATIMEKVGSYGNGLGQLWDRFASDLGSLFGSGDLDDDQLKQRIVKKLKRIARNFDALQVEVIDGQAILAGKILSDNVEKVLKAANKIKGVRGVDNQLEVHESAENIPELQNVRKFGGFAMPIIEGNLSPVARFISMGAGVGLLASCCSEKERNVGTWVKGAIGLALITRSITNKDLRKLSVGNATKMLQNAANSVRSSLPASETLH